MTSEMPSEPIAPTPADRPGPLSRDALDALLREPIVARLGTIDADGYPVIVPIWTEWDGEAIWLVVRDDAADTRALILGRAEIVEGPGPLSGQLEAVARRMARRYEGADGDRYIEESLAWPRLLVRVVPDRIVSWGDAGWHPRYR
jgi:hypothetical protein